MMIHWLAQTQVRGPHRINCTVFVIYGTGGDWTGGDLVGFIPLRAAIVP